MTEMKRKDEAGVESGVVAETGLRLAANGAQSRACVPDLDRYRHHVAHFDLDERQKTDLLLAVWRIMQSFVDRAFGDDPVQHALATRQALREKAESRDDDDSEDEHLTGAFGRHAGDGKAR